jgi:hypothetical protein
MDVYSCCAFPLCCTQKRFCLQVFSWRVGSGTATAGGKTGGKINILNKKIVMCSEKILNYRAK